MTEAEWRTSTNLGNLHGSVRGLLSDRKAALFAVGCARFIEGALADPLVAKAVDLMERIADGQVSADDRRRLHDEAHARFLADVENDHVVRWMMTVETLTSEDITQRCVDVPFYLENAVTGYQKHFMGNQVSPVHRTILRDVVGNPFRDLRLRPISRMRKAKGVFVIPAEWRSSTVRGLAEGIYADRAFDRMPILADALEEAGCDNAEILSHCRGNGPHVRGCRVVDLVLGKS